MSSSNLIAKTIAFLIIMCIIVYVIAQHVQWAKKEGFYQFDNSMSDYSTVDDYAAANMYKQVNPDTVPKEDCWIFYVPVKYHETCKEGYLDKSTGYLLTRRKELEALTNRNPFQQKELDLIKLAIEARNANIIPSNGYGCKMGFDKAKTQVKLDMTDTATISSRNDDNIFGQSTSSTGNWAYCWAPANGEEEARQSVNNIGKTNAISATPNLLATFQDSSDTFYRINFDKLDYDSVKSSMCAIKQKKITQSDTFIFVGFEVNASDQTFRIRNYDVYVLNNNKLMTLKEYNPKANPMDVYSLMFEFKVKTDGIYIGARTTTVNVGLISVDPVCDMVTGPPTFDLKTINIGTQLGIQDQFIMANPENIDLSKGIDGLDEKYNQLAADYIAAQGTLPKKSGVEMRRYDLKPGTTWYGQANSQSTAGMDSLFRDNTQNMVVYYPKTPSLWDWQQNKAWEVIGFLNITVEGTYNFKMSSDDAGEFFVNDVLVSSHYWYHGTDWNATNKDLNLKTVNLAKGFVKFKARFFQLGGPEGLYLYWKKPGDADWSLIPEEVYYYEDNTAARQMNAISQIRDAMTRKLYQNVQAFMSTIPNRAFVPASQSDLISSYISAYDRIYLSFGNPDSVIKPTISSTTRQILQNGVTDCVGLSKTIASPDGIDFTQPAVYTITFWMRVDNYCDEQWRNIVHFGADDGDRTPGIWIWPTWNYPGWGTWRGLALHYRHRASKSNGQQDWNYGINVDLWDRLGKNTGHPYGRWVHIAITANKDYAAIYFNGKKISDTANGDGSLGSYSMQGSGMRFDWGNTSNKKFSLGLSNYITNRARASGPVYIQKLYWYNTALADTEIERIAQEPIAASPSTSYIPTNVATTLRELFANTSTSGETYLKIDNKVYRVYVGVTSYNGETKKWLLILNYLHKGGTNPELSVRRINTDEFPVAGSSALGEDGSQDPKSWGHLGNSFLKTVNDKCGPIRTMRFYAKGGNGDSARWNQSASQSTTRCVHFTTSDQKWINYATTGAGNVQYFSYNTLPDHNASIPQNAGWVFQNQGDYALTEFPFWRYGQAHWGIRGGRAWGNPSRWEVDDYSDGSKYHTHHQVWIGI